MRPFVFEALDAHRSVKSAPCSAATADHPPWFFVPMLRTGIRAGQYLWTGLCQKFDGCPV
ncbi:hypothetical protein C882_2146 [Caenispirillum salinarum AK4]|uniref:Uncharacterized protein n=1 Tax=Caenispirillum salinarum AK4 TaxID=1238182 RepID=K9GP48_9PROT|nr:hypothetical protein C882_2146 [Caenispirillum salinarum AK4]